MFNVIRGRDEDFNLSESGITAKLASVPEAT